VTPDDGDSARLLDLLAGKWRVQAVSTAAALGIADRLGDGPRTPSELAAAIDADPDGLTRLLRVLVGLELLTEDERGRFALTTFGAQLKQDAMGPLATFVGAPEQWDPWPRLRDTLVEGGVAFERTHGAGLYEKMRSDADAARRYDEAVDAFTRHEAAALLDAFDFSTASRVVDVGGGRGTLLCELLTRHAELHGVLCDLPPVIERAREARPESFGDRLAFAAGDFHETIPAGGDVYILKHVLHNWDDERAAALLRRCAEAMTPTGRILVIEGILLPAPHTDTTRLLDLEMLVLTGGRERRKPEWRRLFSNAGLAFEDARRLTPSSWLLVGSTQPART